MSEQKIKGIAFPNLASMATQFVLTDEARVAAIEAIMDTVTAAAAAPRFVFTEGVLGIYGQGTVPLWFTGRSSSHIGAAFANAYISAALDLDDGHRASRGHPGASVVPPVFAELSRLKSSGHRVSTDQVLKAIAVGYEVGLRVAGAKTFYARTGFWAGIAAAASVASLCDLPMDKLAHALAIAAETGPHMATTTAGQAWPQTSGTNIKEGIPWGVVSGMAAVSFAKSGMAGPLDLVDHEPFFDRNYIEAERSRAMVCETYTKFQATCRHGNGPVEAVDALMKKNKVSPGDIVDICVEAYSGALRLSNYTKPSTIVEAQYSIPYCVALSAVKGLDAFLPMDEGDIGNVEAEAIAEKVTVKKCDDFEKEFPAHTLCRVTIRTKTGVFVSPVTAPRGEADRRPDWEQRRKKMESATAKSLAKDARDDLLASLEILRSGDIDNLLDIMSSACVYPDI